MGTNKFKIIICGDTHGDFGPLNKLINNQQPDVVIICGDFGYWPEMIYEKDPWDVYGTTRKYKIGGPFNTDIIKNHDCKVYWIPGNHECVCKDTEFLTKEGWIKSAEITKDMEFAQFEKDTGNISFSKPLKLIKKFEQNLVEIESSKIKQRVTLKHNLVINNEFVFAKDIVGKDIYQNDFRLFGSVNYNDYDISDDMLRLLTWVVCDATIVDASENKKRIQFKLSKERKIQSLRQLLQNLNIAFTIKDAKKSKYNILQPSYIRIYGEYARKIFSLLNEKKQFPDFFKKLSERQVQVVLNELVITDGHLNGNSLSISTTNKCDADLLHTMCILNNRVCHITEKNPHHTSFGKKIRYLLHIYLEKRNPINNLKITSNIIDYNDYVYCVTMPEGTIITRLNGKSNFTGNCWDDIDKNFYRNAIAPIEMEAGSNVFFCPIGSVIQVNDLNFLCVGGANSQDKEYRTSGIDWFPQENLTFEDYQFIMNNVVGIKIDCIVSHTCPRVFKVQMDYPEKWSDPNRLILDQFVNHFKPDKYFFGHWHHFETGKHNNTQWYMLDHNRGGNRWWINYEQA